MEPTKEQMKRLQHDHKAIAQEVVTVEYCNGLLVTKGSELACLRIFHKLRNSKYNPRVTFSTNLNTWVYTQDYK